MILVYLNQIFPYVNCLTMKIVELQATPPFFSFILIIYGAPQFEAEADCF